MQIHQVEGAPSPICIDNVVDDLDFFQTRDPRLNKVVPVSQLFIIRREISRQ